MQRGIFRRCAGIAGYDVQLRNRYIEFGIVRVLQMQKFCFPFTQIDGDESTVASDAVMSMDDRVADFQFGQITDDGFDMEVRFRLAAAAPSAGIGIQFRFRDEGEIAEYVAEGKPFLERCDGEHHFF